MLQRAIFRRNTCYARFLLLYFLHETLPGARSQGRGGRRGFSVSHSSCEQDQSMSTKQVGV